MKRELEQRDWIQVKRRYIYTDISYKALSEELGCLRQTVMSNLKKRFPNVNLKERKAEEKLKRENLALDKTAESRVAKELQAASTVDAMDNKHLDLINKALDMAAEGLENKTLKPKDIKDLKELINLERLIADKRTSNDKVIVIRAEIPEKVDKLPEVIDAEFEEV